MARANQPAFVLDAGPDWLLIDLGQATLISHKLSGGGRAVIVRAKEGATEEAGAPSSDQAATPIVSGSDDPSQSSLELAHEIATLLERRLAPADRPRAIDVLLAVLAVKDPALIRGSFLGRSE